MTGYIVAMFRLLKKIRLSWPILVLLVSYGYLGFHALGGSLGVLKLADYSDRSKILKADIGQMKLQREVLELRASQLRSISLDLDRLDEQARRSLNVSGANDIVIWLDGTP